MAYCSNCGREISDMAITCPNCGHPGPAAEGMGAPQPGVVAAQAVRYAGWWQRVGATLLDGLVVGVPLGILSAVLFPADPASIDPVTQRPVAGTGGGGGGQYILWIGYVLYKTILEGGSRGQTVGKMALRISVRDGDAGGPIGYGRAFLRWLVGGLLWVALIIPGIINVLFPLWDARKQTLHDKAARSVVVQLP